MSGEVVAKKIKFKLPGTMVSSIFWIVVGVILLVFPGQSLDTICRIAGVLVLVMGIIQLVIGLMGAGAMPGQASIVIGAVISLLGLFVIIRPDIIVSILPFVAGIVIIVHGIGSLVNAFNLIGGKDKYWWIGLLLSIITICLGCLLFFRSHEVAEFTARIIGLFLLYGGISNLWIHYRKAKVAKLKKQEEDALDVEATITDID